MIPMVLMLEGVACMAGAWISPGRSWGHFPEEAFSRDLLSAGILALPLGRAFLRPKMYSQRIRVKAASGWGAWRRRTTTAVELPQGTPTSP